MLRQRCPERIVRVCVQWLPRRLRCGEDDSFVGRPAPPHEDVERTVHPSVREAHVDVVRKPVRETPQFLRVEAAGRRLPQRLSQLPRELAEMLVGTDDRQAVTPCLGQQVLEAPRQGQEVVALVDVEAGVAARGLAGPGSRRDRLPHLGHHERAEDPRRLVAQDPLRHPHEQQTAVEDVGGHVEAGAG